MSIFKFHKVLCRHYSGEVKTFIWFCIGFTQETMYQILSKSPEFYRRYYDKYFGLFFSGHTESKTKGRRQSVSSYRIHWIGCRQK